MEKMRKMRRAAVILIVLWLLPHVPSITFFSERPHLVSLAVDRKVASQACGQQCRSTASRGSLIKPALDTMSASGFLNPVMVIHTVGAFIAVIATAWFALHLILVEVSIPAILVCTLQYSIAREKAISKRYVYHNINEHEFY